MELVATILIDGVAYGMVLFMVAVGLAVTLGLMRIVNLAHGAFAMVGGYITAHLTQQLSFPFELALLIAILAVMALSLPVEKYLLRRVYRRSDLDQALITIGVMFVAIAAANLVFGSTLKIIALPSYLSGSFDLGFRYVPKQRLFLIGVGLVVLLLLWLAIDRTLFGVRVRAAVSNVRMAEAIGIDTRNIYVVVFAIGAGLAALGGIVGAEILPMEPTYPSKYLVLFLAVVAVAGMGTVVGTFGAAMLLGMVETAAKYIMPELSSILFFATMIVVLSWRPQGLFGRA